jgi:hypothetical protein
VKGDSGYLSGEEKSVDVEVLGLELVILSSGKSGLWADNRLTEGLLALVVVLSLS